jgi:hypothetical protein
MFTMRAVANGVGVELIWGANLLLYRHAVAEFWIGDQAGMLILL